MRVFRTVKTKTDPETNKRVPVLNRSGKPVLHVRWRYEFTDWTGRRKKGTGYPNKQDTLEFVARLQAEADAIRNGHLPPPKESKKHSNRTFAEVKEEFIKWGLRKGGRGGRPWAEVHARKRREKLEWWEKKLKLKSMKEFDITLADRVEAVLDEMVDQRKSGKTVWHYKEGLQSFCAWCVKQGYLDDHPLKRLKGYDRSPQTKRRALTREEIGKLLTKCRPQWRLLYEMALCTGLRAGELRALRIWHLDIDQKGLHLEASWTKSRKAGFQPLPEALVEKLAGTAVGKEPGDKLLEVPDKPSIVLNRDLYYAGIRKHELTGKVDFHGLRTTYINLVLESGASLKEAMDLARHSTVDMTMVTYARSGMERRSLLAEEVGKAVSRSETAPTETQREMATEKRVVNTESLMVRGGGLEPPQPCGH